MPPVTKSNIEPVDKCWFCGVNLYHGSEVYALGEAGSDLEMLQEDHLTPKSRGGCDSPKNKVSCCRSCNARKKDKTLKEYRLYLAKQQVEYKAAKDLMEVANEFDLPENDAIQRAAGRLLDRADSITFYGEDHE